MKTPVAALAVAALSLALGSSAKAQTVVYGGSWGTAPVVAGPTFADPFYVPPYSYYAAYPGPARGYVGYGTSDFPFYGRPYGGPSDRWSWAAMSTNGNGVLARYYYPPVR
ncbi:hypothetical protein [Singulisphaera acidiphila]|uniref:Uncharacterized protein n=1 Tax=Singulisphaera acidiphila (strain ATCC BAA-1392 / DSM 18658 / VKM B-2454 / MOB10) TaxID=886293 RepID=L0DG98_SINAD|nr:hypothetical protein [Singulisphaera acidiphila]AGA27706.1 hypothetical protein Sinac_3445 [Singulisphaera acidiphila DSM 18658]